MNQAEIRRRQIGEFSNILTLVTLFIIGRLMKDKAITYTAVAVEMCLLLWSIIGGCLSDSLGKLLRNRRNKGQYKNAAKMRKSAMIFQLALGAVGSLILIVSARPLAENLFGIRYSAFILIVLSPIVLLRSVSSVLAGYFQGQGAELPTAASGILRQLFILGLGIFFSGMLNSYGEKVSGLLQQENFAAMYSGVGVAIAICLAELLVILFLFLIYKISHRAEKKDRQEGMRTTDSVIDCIRYLFGNRLPQALTQFMLVLSLMLGMIFLGKAFDEETMASIYGAYIGKYLVICGVLVSLIFVIVLPSIGRIFGLLRKDEKRYARMTFQSGVHICVVHSIFLAVFVAVMGTQIVGFLCPDSNENVIPMLQSGSAVIVFGILSFYFARFLQIAGKKFLMLGMVAIADILYVIFTMVMLNTAKAGALALVYSGMIGLFVLCILIGMLSYRQMHIGIDWLRILILPLGSACVAGLMCMFLSKYLTPHLGNWMTMLVSFVLSGTVYWVLLLIFRDFREQELEVIPGGRLIRAFGQMLRIY